MRRVGHSDSRSARSRRSQSGAPTEGRHAAPLPAPGTARWSAQEEASARALGSARRGARPAFRPQWVCGQPHPWPILGSRPQRQEEVGRPVRHAVAEPWDPDHSARSSWAGLASSLPSGPNAAPPDQAPSSQPSAPTYHRKSSSEAALQNEKGGSQPGELPASPPPRSEELAPEQLEARPHLLNRIRAPSWSDTPAGTHHGALFTEAPAQLEGGLWPKAHTAQAGQSGDHRSLRTAREGVAGSRLGPGRLRHKANLSHGVGWRADKVQGAWSSKAHRNQAMKTAWVFQLGTGWRCRRRPGVPMALARRRSMS